MKKLNTRSRKDWQRYLDDRKSQYLRLTMLEKLYLIAALEGLRRYYEANKRKGFSEAHRIVDALEQRIFVSINSEFPGKERS